MIKRISYILMLGLAFVMSNVYAQDAEKQSKNIGGLSPFSDPGNKGIWIYNAEVSDEFNSEVIDENRWYIVGKFDETGKPFYKHPDKPYKKVWKGRAPSQFSGRNYRLGDGKLYLQTKWEPDFPFSDEIRKPVFGDPYPYENITTACFIGRKEFQYGYIEIRSKAAKGPVTSGFWSMGERLEFDFFETYGGTLDPKKKHLDKQLWWSIRDWNKPVGGKPVYTEKKDVGFTIADDYHIWGIEWDEKGVKYYIDGKLFSEVSAEEVTKWARENRDVPNDYDGYVATKPIHIWLDMEIFPWHDIPKSKEELETFSGEANKHDGILEFEIDYVRVWQKNNR
ncbi:family 16 glycosylhydrolase [Flavobacteriaceae bacterium]|nr:family 16 glycosylhydrolase [Flavobacteriaceae bacterium]